MPTGLQEPKKGGFEISLATDLYSCCSEVSPPLNFTPIHVYPRLSVTGSVTYIDGILLENGYFNSTKVNAPCIVKKKNQYFTHFNLQLF